MQTMEFFDFDCHVNDQVSVSGDRMVLKKIIKAGER